jgi:predicted small secreted protein
VAEDGFGANGREHSSRPFVLEDRRSTVRVAVKVPDLPTSGLRRRVAPVRSRGRPSELRRIQPMPKRSIAVVTALVAALALTACANTIRGAGRDVQQTGDAIEDATN